MIIADDSLSDNERAYLLSVASNDVINLRNILEDLENSLVTFNFDCLDFRKRSALHLAVENENVDIIELLINKLSYSCMEEALLHAINKDSVKTVKAIIEHPSFIAKCQDSKKNHAIGGDDDDYHQFPHDVTPLILAAQRNNHEVIQMFLSRNFVIEKPHWVSCTCIECSSGREKDSLKRSRSRLNAYRALVSPAYMALSSPDPIMTTFELRQEMKKLAQVEKEFKNEYTSLVEQCMDFACELMDLCRGTQEVEAVLSDHVTGSDPLARLKMALKYDEKKFVAHPNCQQHLTSVWYGAEMGFLQSMSPWKQALFWILGCPIVPFLCLLYLACPNSKIAKMLKCPASKFIAHTMSNLFFLLLISMATFSTHQYYTKGHVLPGNEVTEKPDRYNFHYLTSCQHLHLFHQSEASLQARGHMSRVNETRDVEDEEEVMEGLLRNTLRSCNVLITNVHICLLVYVLGMMWTECKQLYSSGINNYLTDNYNWIDFIVLSLYLSCYALKVIVHFKVASSDWFFDGAASRARRVLQKRDFESFKGIVQETCNKSSIHEYYMRASRFEWRMNDPEIVSDMLFGLANVWSIARTTYLMPAFEVLGPLQIALGRMMADITRFLVLFALVLLAFMVGLHNLYCYYGAQTFMITNNGTTKLMHSSEAFKDLWRTLLSLFWSMFGLVGLDSIEIIHPHLSLPLSNHTTDSGFINLSHALPSSPSSSSLSSYQDMIDRPNSTVVVEGVGLLLFALYHVTVIIVLVNMLIAMMSHSFEAIQGDCDVEWKFARTNLWMNYMGLGDTLPSPFNMLPSINSFSFLFNLLRSFFCRHSYANIGDKDDVNNDGGGSDNDDDYGGYEDGNCIIRCQKRKNGMTCSYCCWTKNPDCHDNDDEDDGGGNDLQRDDLKENETETGNKVIEPKRNTECFTCFKTLKYKSSIGGYDGDDDDHSCSVIKKFCRCTSRAIVGVADNDCKDYGDDNDDELKVKNIIIVNQEAQFHDGNIPRNRFIPNQTHNRKRTHHHHHHHQHRHHQHHDHRKHDQSSNADILQRLVRRYLFKLERLKDETAKDILSNTTDATFVTDYSKERKDSDFFRRKPLSSHGSNQSLVLNFPPSAAHSSTTGTAYKSFIARVPGRSRPPSIVRRRHHQQLYHVQLQPESQHIEQIELQQSPTERPFKQLEQIPSVNEPPKRIKPILKQRSSLSPSPSISPHSPLSPSTTLQLMSLPRIDAIMRSIRIFQTRVEQVDADTLKRDSMRDDIKHVEKLLVENYKALSSLLLVLKSVHLEVEALKTLTALKRKNASKVAQ